MSDDDTPPTRGRGLNRTTTVRHIKPRGRGTGRGQGVRRSSISVKDALLNAFDKAGGEDYLLLIARKEPKTFITMLTKLLPTKVEGDEAFTKAMVQVLTGVPRNPNDPLPGDANVIEGEAEEIPPPATDMVH